VRVSLVLSRPLEVLLPLEQWVGRGLRALIGTASSGTSGAYGNAALGLSSWLAGQVLVRTELLWAVEPPTWMGPLGGLDMPDEVGLVLRCQANLASLAALAGRGGGGWESQLEVLLRGVPGAALALVPGMGSPEWKWAEVTLLRVALREAATPRVLLSQVLYDVRGRDSDLEFVEVVNAWDRVVDLEGFVLEDNGGRYKVRGACGAERDGRPPRMGPRARRGPDGSAPLQRGRSADVVGTGRDGPGPCCLGGVPVRLGGSGCQRGICPQKAGGQSGPV